jgi:hypothetical protein
MVLGNNWCKQMIGTSRVSSHSSRPAAPVGWTEWVRQVEVLNGLPDIILTIQRPRRSQTNEMISRGEFHWFVHTT